MVVQLMWLLLLLPLAVLQDNNITFSIYYIYEKLLENKTEK